MRLKDLDVWLNDSITQEFLALVKDHRDASYRMITESMLNVPSLKDVDMTMIAEYRGQVNSLDLLLDIQNFLREKLDQPKQTIEVDNEEVNSIRGQLNS